jgi:hypothetical protein
MFGIPEITGSALSESTSLAYGAKIRYIQDPDIYSTSSTQAIVTFCRESDGVSGRPPSQLITPAT